MGKLEGDRESSSDFSGVYDSNNPTVGGMDVFTSFKALLFKVAVDALRTGETEEERTAAVRVLKSLGSLGDENFPSGEIKVIFDSQGLLFERIRVEPLES